MATNTMTTKTSKTRHFLRWLDKRRREPGFFLSGIKGLVSSDVAIFCVASHIPGWTYTVHTSQDWLKKTINNPVISVTAAQNFSSLHAHGHSNDFPLPFVFLATTRPSSGSKRYLSSPREGTFA